jgi:hypothetical protein
MVLRASMRVVGAISLGLAVFVASVGRADSSDDGEIAAVQPSGAEALDAGGNQSGAESPDTGEDPAEDDAGEPLSERLHRYWEANFIDPEDGEFDASQFLASRSGVLAAPIFLTEPTLGYGGGANLLFLQPRHEKGREGYLRPDVTIVGGLMTENGTWAGFAGDLRHWLDGRVKTVVGGMKARLRLDFYGLGIDRIVGDRPLGYELDVNGARAGGQYRVPGTDFWIGGSYQFATIDASFAQNLDLPLPDVLDLGFASKKTTLSGPIFRATYDSRNSIFAPDEGYYGQVELATGFEALGGTSSYQTLDVVNIAYFPLSQNLYVGFRSDFKRTFGDAPFYLKPALAFEGIPAMRYQGHSVLQGQGQISWRFWDRFSVVGFIGGGGAWNRGARFREAKSVYAGGGGLRYDLARLFRLQYGLDYAYGPDGGTVYVVVGSAWKFPGSGL